MHTMIMLVRLVLFAAVGHALNLRRGPRVKTPVLSTAETLTQSTIEQEFVTSCYRKQDVCYIELKSSSALQGHHDFRWDHIIPKEGLTQIFETILENAELRKGFLSKYADMVSDWSDFDDRIISESRGGKEVVYKKYVNKSYLKDLLTNLPDRVKFCTEATCKKLKPPKCADGQASDLIKRALVYSPIFVESNPRSKAGDPTDYKNHLDTIISANIKKYNKQLQANDENKNFTDAEIEEEETAGKEAVLKHRADLREEAKKELEVLNQKKNDLNKFNTKGIDFAAIASSRGEAKFRTDLVEKYVNLVRIRDTGANLPTDKDQHGKNLLKAMKDVMHAWKICKRGNEGEDDYPIVDTPEEMAVKFPVRYPIKDTKAEMVRYKITEQGAKKGDEASSSSLKNASEWYKQNKWAICSMEDSVVLESGLRGCKNWNELRHSLL